MKCLGRTKTLKRCKRDAKRLFCHHHRFQPWTLLFTIFVVLNLFFDLPQFIKLLWTSNIDKPHVYEYVFPEYEKNLDQKYKSFIFPSESLEEIKTSFLKPLNLEVRCPCGSGKKYGECHHPNIDKNDSNLWRGPGFPQSLIFGYREPLNGIYFDKKNKGDIIVLKGDVRVSLCKYFTMDYSVLLNKAIVQSLSLSEKNGNLIFTGVINVEGDLKNDNKVIIGTPSSNFVTNFESKVNGKGIPHESGNWAGFISDSVNPMEGIRNHKWYRYFLTKGFLIEFKPNNQLIFKISKKIEDKNIFSLSLPFNSISLAYPQIITETKFSQVTFEVERENIYWDLFLDHGQFSEPSQRQKDSLFLVADEQDEDVSIQFDGIRQLFLGPRKIRISLIVNN